MSGEPALRLAWDVEQVRKAERKLMARLPDGALMRRAAAGLARRCASLLPAVYGGRVVLLVGAGNNGGDALYAGARLARRGADVVAVLLEPGRAHAGGLAALRRAGGSSVSGVDPVSSAEDALSAVDVAELVVDGIVGIGGTGALRAPADRIVAAVPETALIVAVDVPSGVDAGTGAVPGAAVHANVTVTFGCLKPGLVVGPGRAASGVVELVDIGLGPHLPADQAALQVIGPDQVRPVLPAPRSGDDKYTRGVVGVASGSAAYGGAAVLSVGGAVRAGAGMVRYVGPAADRVRARWPEVIVSEGAIGDAGRVQAWVVGPGLGTDETAARTLRDVLRTDLPVLVDAGGLTLLTEHLELVRDRSAPTVLTPHDREFARLFGEVGEDRVAAARRAAQSLGGQSLGDQSLGGPVTVLLKGNATVVAGGGSVSVNPTGTPWLGTAGTGDVLSGVIGAFLAGGHDGPASARAGAYVHGLAGSRAADGGPISAYQVLEAVPDAIRTLLRRPA